MIGLKCLQQGAPRPLSAPGPARHLIEQLKRPLGGARIAIGQPDVGVHHADQSQMWEMMALGDELGADDQIEFAILHRLQFGPHPLRSARHVRGQHQQARLGEKLGGLLRKAFDPRATGDQRLLGPAGRAFVRSALDMAAMVADQGAARAMLDQPGRAVRALEAVAAGATQGQRRIAAPVEEKQRLFMAREILSQRLNQARRNPPAA